MLLPEPVPGAAAPGRVKPAGCGRPARMVDQRSAPDARSERGEALFRAPRRTRVGPPEALKTSPEVSDVDSRRPRPLEEWGKGEGPGPGPPISR